MRHAMLARQRGFNMIEVLITLVILLFGLLGLAGLTAQGQRAELESYQRVQAMVLLQDMVGRISANRTVAACYAISNIGSGTPYFGTGSSALPACSAGTVPAYTRANDDLAAWDALLRGSAETSSGTSVGAMIGARGCVSVLSTNRYLITVAWQGIGATAAPSAGLTCGINLYGTETQRRVVSTTISVPTLN